MAARTALVRALVGSACLLAACTPASGPPSSVLPTESPAAVGNLPTGCEPINLRSPAGEAVDLNGIWVQDAQGSAQPSKWWIQTFGNCIWGSGIYDDYSEDVFLARAESVQALQGMVSNDFVIEGTIVLLGPHPAFAVLQLHSEVRLLIEFDVQGEITLREDRVPGVQGPRCPDAVGYCPAPFLLRRSR
jgi:hypothetical protein